MTSNHFYDLPEELQSLVTIKSYEQLDDLVKKELINAAQKRLEKMEIQWGLRQGLVEELMDFEGYLTLPGFGKELVGRKEWQVEFYVARQLFDFCLATEGFNEGWEETWEDLNIIKQENGLYLLDSCGF